MSVCPICGVEHGNYETIEQALDILMNESFDTQCRVSAKQWILNLFKIYDYSNRSKSVSEVFDNYTSIDEKVIEFVKEMMEVARTSRDWLIVVHSIFKRLLYILGEPQVIWILEKVKFELLSK